MLTAKTADGTIIILSQEFERKKLREWRKSTAYFCPQCERPVRLKVGEIVIPHFAHEKEASCSAAFSEGESQVHLEGKQQLYDFFNGKVDDVVLEPYFKLLSQRPDLLVTTRSDHIPIEFQCSTIPIEKVKSRTKGYLSAGMKPIWIMQTPVHFSTLPQGVDVFQFSKFQESFFTHTSPEGTVFLTYNPQSKQFHYFSSLIHMSGRRYVGLHRILPISVQVFPFARPIPPSIKELRRYVSAYLESRSKFLKSRILLNRRGINDPFLRSCYDLRIMPVELPLWIGLPVPFSNAFHEHSCEWQMVLFYFMRRNRISLNKLSEKLIRKFVTQLKKPSDEQVYACLAYRDLLISIGVESPQKAVNFCGEKIVQLFAERFLAKSHED